MGAFNSSPSQSPRLALRQVDIDIDGGSVVENTPQSQTPPRERLIPRNNTTPALLPSLVESSPTTSELEVRASVIDILSKGEKEALNRSIEDPGSASTPRRAGVEEGISKEGEVRSLEADEKPRIIIGDEPVLDDEEEVESPSLKVGDVVRISESLEGQVRFYGKTQFADGTWVGIALSIPEGI